jgi:predicted nucleic acid-binding protein
MPAWTGWGKSIKWMILNPANAKTCMAGNVFIDTNIFLYAKFDDGSLKHRIAKDLLKSCIQDNTSVISTQVINEFCVNAVRQGGDPIEIRSTAESLAAKFRIVPISMYTVVESFRIYRAYHFSHWDCLIIAAALESQCKTLFTEDLSDGQIVDGFLNIKNPFVHWPASA